jgi:predicted transcriptional regulator
MVQGNISEVPVLQGWKFMGIIRLSEVAGSVVNSGLFQGPSLKDARKVQNQKVVGHLHGRRMGLKPDNNMASVLAYIRKNNAEIVPIIDPQMRLMGVIYASDVRKEVSRMLAEGNEKPNMLSSLLQGPERLEGQTPIDQLVHLVEKRGSIRISEAARVCGLSNSEIQDYAKSLEKSNLVRIEYGLLGMWLKRPEKPRQGILP